MKFTDLKKKTVKELRSILAEERTTLYDLRLKLSVNQLKDVRQVREVRKNIARILTRIGQLEAKEEKKPAEKTS